VKNFGRWALFLRHDFPAINQSSLLLNRLRKTSIASGDAAMKDKDKLAAGGVAYE